MNFKDYIHQETQIDNETLTLLDNLFKPKEYKKYSILLKEGNDSKYKPQNRQYKNTQIEKSLKTPINKGIEAKKPQNRDKTKCTITTI